MTAEEFARFCDGARPTKRGYIARCPAHDDRSPSLSIADGEPGYVLLHCHAGCSFEAIVDAVGLRPSDLMPERLPIEHSTAKRKTTRTKIETEVLHELYVLAQVLQARVSSHAPGTSSSAPKHRAPYPREHWDRERLAAKRLQNALHLLYGGIGDE